MLRIVLAALLLGTYAASAKTKHPAPQVTQVAPAQVQGCESISASFGQMISQGGKAQFMTSDELKRATLIYNNIPPAEDTKWDFGIFLDKEDESGGVMFGKSGAVCRSMGFDSPGTWEAVKKAILGGQWV